MPELPGLPEVPWMKDIRQMDDDLLKARLGGLPVEVQARLVTSLDWDTRLKVIRSSGVAREIVQALPAEEVFLTVKSAEEGDALLMIGLTSPDQLRFMLDMELWTGDRLDAGKARQWLMYILACGEQKVIELLEHSDRELLTMMLSKLVSLIPNEEGVTVEQGLSSIMPDEFFTILSSIPEETENVRLLLRIIRQWDRGRFYNLLFDIYGTSGIETEEEALRWRNSRLEEKGLLEFDEAIEIYAYVGEQEAKELADRALEMSRPSQAEYGLVPVYPVVLAEPKTLFYRTLVSIDDPSEQNRLRSEIAFSANRLLVADAERIGEIDAIKSSLNRLFSLANVGLLFLSGGDAGRAGGIVKSMPVRDVFQIGFSRVADLGSLGRKIARNWWPEWRETGFLLLDFPGDEVLAGVLRRVPQYHDLPGGGGTGFRDFITFEEVARTRRTLEEVAVVAEALFEHLGIPAPHRADLDSDEVFVSGLEEITMRSLVLTGFVHFSLKGSFEVLPLTAEDLTRMFTTVLDRSPSGRRRIRPDPVDGFLSWLAGQTGYEGSRLEVLEGYFKAAVMEFEDEVGGFGSAGEFDPRYVRTIIVAKRD